MALITQSGPQTLKVGQPAPGFRLPATDGKTYGFDDFSGKKAFVIAFTCNHCPYAQANEERFNALAKEFQEKGAAFLAINANDDASYPEDSFENMKLRAREKKYAYPYLHDADQAIAKAYGAVCTPHYFLVDQHRKLAYEGRLDDNWQNPQAVKSRELRSAIEAVLAGKPVSPATTNPMGCSIKWKGKGRG